MFPSLPCADRVGTLESPGSRHRLLEIVGEDSRLWPPAGWEHDKGDHRVEGAFSQNLDERARRKLLRTHPDRRDGDAKAERGADDDARG